MNLVDAIRRASSQAAPTAEEISAAAEAAMAANGTPLTVVTEAEYEPTDDLKEAFEANVVKTQTSSDLNLVRLEVFLTHEQTHALLRGALATRHSVMTAREVASYLRLTSHQVEDMAEQGQLPGFQIEGSWRFMKSAMDEWLAEHANQNRGADHGA